MLTKAQLKYIEEHEKYKDITIKPGKYLNKKRPSIEYEVITIGIDEITIKTGKSGHTITKTLHWCRKNLLEINK